MAASDQIGALFVAIGADLSGLVEGIGPGGKADKELESFTGRTNRSLMGIAKVGAALAATGVVAVAVGLGVATKSAADFETKLTELVTGAGETSGNLNLVSDGLLKMAGQVGQTASTLADGLFMIESAGYRGAQGLDVLRASAEGAKVGGADLATVADAVTTVLKDYHMPATQAADATNFLVGVVKQGKTHMQDLAASLAMVLPFASALHVPLDQVGGAMATMTAKGVPAADAATYLKFTLMALANETPKGTKALKDIGLTSSEVASSLTSKGLLPTLEMIQTALAKKFPKGGAAMTATLADIVGGTRGMGAALQLTGQNLSDFIASTKGVSDAITSGKGKVIGWAKVQQDFNFKWQKTSDALDAAEIRIGSKLLPVLGKLFDKITPAIPQIAAMGGAFLDKAVPAVEQFAGWLSSLRPDFVKAFDIISTLKPYLIDIGVAWAAWNVALAVTKAMNFATFLAQMVTQSYIAASATKDMTVGQWLLNVALDANPIGVVIIAVAALAAGFIWAYKNVGWFRDIVNGLGDALKAFAQQFWTDIKPIFDAIGGAISGIQSFTGQSHSSAPGRVGNRGLRSFDMGGIVPGAMGAPMLAVVHGGERVLTPQQQTSGGGDMGETNALIRQLISAVTATPGGQTGIEAALYKATHLANTNRARGMSGA